MSHYVYAPAFGALPVRALPVRAGALPTREQRNAAALEQARRATPAQKREALKNNRAMANAEIAKQGISNFVEVLANGELKLKTPFSVLDDFGRRMLNQQLPVFSVDASGKVSSKGVAPGTQIVDAMPMLNAEQKRQLKAAPFSFFAGVIDPFIDHIFGAAVQQVMDAGMTSAQRAAKTAKDTGELFKGGYVYDLTTFPFNLATLPVQAIGIDLSKANLKAVNIALEQPGDELFEPVSRRQLKSIRTALAFFVLYFKKWVELHAAFIALLFPEEKVALEKTTGTLVNTPATAFVVDRIPDIPQNAVARNLFRREGTFNGKVVFAVQIPAATGRGTTGYYTLSPKGLLDRAIEAQRQWDQKYEAYKNDKITNATGVIFYGPRMTFLRSQGKTETQARNIIAAEDNFPKQFAEAGSGAGSSPLPTQFRVLFDRPDLGGGLDVENGPRPSDAFIQKLRAEEAAARTATVATVKIDLGPITSGSTSLTSERVKLGSLDGNYVSSSGLGSGTGAEAPAAGFVLTIEGTTITIGTEVALAIIGFGSLVVLASVALPSILIYNIIMGSMGRSTTTEITSGGIKSEQTSDEAAVPAAPPAPPPPPAPLAPPATTPAPPPPAASDDPRLGARGEPGGGTGPSTGGEEGFPVIPVALAAGLALFLLARR
jgi:hypothetical protein